MIYENWVKQNKCVRVQEIATPNKNYKEKGGNYGNWLLIR